MRLGIDLDGVVADFNRGWTDLYNAEHQTALSSASVTRWDQIPDLTHFNHMGEFWRWASEIEGGSLFRHLEPFPGAIEALETLAEDHDIVVVTTKPRFAVHDTFAWIAQHRLPTREVHITNRKWRVACDVYLDDGPHVLDGLMEKRPEATVCRYVRPWNHPVPNVVDIHDWDEFIRLIHGIQPDRTGSARL